MLHLVFVMIWWPFRHTKDASSAIAGQHITDATLHRGIIVVSSKMLTASNTGPIHGWLRFKCCPVRFSSQLTGCVVHDYGGVFNTSSHPCLRIGQCLSPHYLPRYLLHMITYLLYPQKWTAERLYPSFDAHKHHRMTIVVQPYCIPAQLLRSSVEVGA